MVKHSAARFASVFLFLVLQITMILSVPASAHADGTLISAPARRDMAYSPSSGVLYITSGDSVLRWDVASESFLPTITVGGSLYGIDLSEDEKTLAVGNMQPSGSLGGLVKIDTTSLEVSSVVGYDPTWSLAWTSDAAIITATNVNYCLLQRHDTAAGTTAALMGTSLYRPNISAGPGHAYIVWMDAKTAAARMGRYRVSDHSVIDTTVEGGVGRSLSISVSHDGSRTLTANEFVREYNAMLTPTGRKIGSGVSPDSPSDAVFHPDGDVVFATFGTQRAVLAFDAGSHAPLYRFGLGTTTNLSPAQREFPEGRLKISPAGDLIFALVPAGIRYYAISGLRGTVTSEFKNRPLAGAEIEIWRQDTGLWTVESTVSADAIGTWSYDPGDSGTRKVRVTDPSGAHAPKWFGGTDVESAAEITPGDRTITPADIRLELQSASSITGSAIDAVTRRPVPGATVSLYDAATNTAIETTVTGPTGAYGFIEMAPGQFKIGVGGMRNVYGDRFHRASSSLESATVIDASAGATTVIEPIELVPTPYFTGTVRSAASGKPLAGIEVRVYDATAAWAGASDSLVARATTAADGTYRVPGLSASTWYIIGFADSTSTYRDIVWPQAGWHISDAWAFRPAPEGGILKTDAYLPTLAQLKSTRVERVAGANRYATSIAISKRNFAKSDYAVLVSGTSFADALSASPLAGIHECPILLTDPARLDAALLSELRRLKVKHIEIVGGKASVSAASEQKLKSLGYTVFRYGGVDRYAVSARVAAHVMNEQFRRARVENRPVTNTEPFVVRGDVFADALSVSSFANMQVRPILLCPTWGMTAELKSFWRGYHILAKDEVIFVGGPVSITNEMYMDFFRISADRLDNVWIWDKRHPDRYGTSAAVVDYFQNYYYGVQGFESLGVASGATFPDALAGGAACGYNFGPLVLTPGNGLAGTSGTSIRASGPYVMHMQVFGGGATISNATLGQARAALGSAVYDLDRPGNRVPLEVSPSFSESRFSALGEVSERRVRSSDIGTLPPGHLVVPPGMEKKVAIPR